MNAKKRAASIGWKLTFHLSTSLLSASCARDDWIAEVTCNTPPNSAIPLMTELSSSEKRLSSVGYLNSSRLALGTIVRIARDSTLSPAFTEWRVLTPSGGDVSTSPITLTSISIGRGFQVNLKQDIRTAAEHLGINLSDAVLKNTTVHIGGPVVRSLDNVTAFINRDSEIVAGIRSDPDGQFAIVYRTVDGQIADLRPPSSSFIAVNTFFLPEAYVHVSYACPVVESFSREHFAGIRPMVIYMTAVRYDDTTRQLLTESQPGDNF